MAYKGGRYGDSRSLSCVYVGNLPDDIKERELEDLFYKFGRIVDIDIKKGRTTNGTAYAFVEFENMREAEKAVERRDGYLFYHTRIRVELTGDRRPRRREGYNPPIQRRTFRTEYRAIVTHLPQGCRWQHLKDHMRKAGDVGYANVEAGRGIVEYMRYDDLRYAVEKLDGSEMIGPFGAAAIIKVREDDYGGGYGRDAYQKKRYRSISSEKDFKRRRSSCSGSFDKNYRDRSASDYEKHNADTVKSKRDAHRRSCSHSKSYRDSRSRSRSRSRSSSESLSRSKRKSLSKSRSRNKSQNKSDRSRSSGSKSNDRKSLIGKSVSKNKNERSKSRSLSRKNRSRSKSRSLSERSGSKSKNVSDRSSKSICKRNRSGSKSTDKRKNSDSSRSKSHIKSLNDNSIPSINHINDNNNNTDNIDTYNESKENKNFIKNYQINDNDEKKSQTDMSQNEQDQRMPSLNDVAE